MAEETVKLQVELTAAEVWAFAQFVKRAGWQEFRANAVDDDEAYCMRDAFNKVWQALKAVGVAPR